VLQRWTLWDLSTSWLAVSTFLFIMHPSSFYDLQARYIYTPLYGPYSLSEALHGLIFYSLNKSQDSISISSKRSLWHELISELSNAIDDLQDYLLYFSSNFLIFPPDSLDLIKELWTSCDDFKNMIICWDTLITRLITAHKIVEHYFWPHLFQPAIDNPANLQRLRQFSSFILPNMALDKLFMPASALVSPYQTDSTPCTTTSPFELEHQPLNIQSEHLQLAPSETFFVDSDYYDYESSEFTKRLVYFPWIRGFFQRGNAEI